jgi:Clp amino terminal domain, pathogenicity island component
MEPIEPIPRAVDIARPAGLACTMGRWEASRLHHAYVGPEHLLVGLLRQGDNPAARVLVAHGLDLAAVRAEVDRLIAQGVLPGPPSDAELGRQQELQARWLDAQDLAPEERARVELLIAQGVLPAPHLGDAAPLAGLGIDLEAVAGRLEESFGREAYWQAAERVRNRPVQAATHRPMGVPPPFVCARVFAIAAHEAIARDQPVGPEHLLLGLLGDAEDPVETEPYPQERRLRGQVGLPDHGPHAIKLLVEAQGLTLEGLRAAVLSELDRGGDGEGPTGEGGHHAAPW